ncbi:unnamed protein product [Amaranthus hypochondriacus]
MDQDFWKEAQIAFPYPLGSSFRDVVAWFWTNKDREGLASFLTLGWQVWKAQNEAIFNSVDDPPSLCVRKSLDWLSEYQKALSYGLERPISSLA